jgi:hypothetical protein
MEVIYFSETSVEFQQTAWRHVLEDIILHRRRCQSLKTYISYWTYTLLLPVCTVTTDIKAMWKYYGRISG